VLSSDPLAFPVQHDCPVSLPPFGQCSATIWFRPQAAGPAQARISMVNTSGQPLREATLAGTGTHTAPAALAWSANPLQGIDFGPVALGQSARRELSLSNRSSQAVNITTLRITGPNASRFTLDAPCAASGRLDAQASCAVTIGFAPGSAGRAEGWIELVSDASNAHLVRIAAAGVAAVAADPVATPPVSGGGGSGGGGGAMSAGWLGLLLAAVLALRRPR
jgi:Abnormal spindle-like microcephaly-assoc'd, ASPM-SPD-2-Hydin